MTQKQMLRVIGSLWVRCVLLVLWRPISCTIAILSIRDSSKLSEIGTGKCSGPFTHFKHSSWATYLPSPQPLFSRNRGSCLRIQVPQRTVSEDTCFSHCCWWFLIKKKSQIYCRYHICSTVRLSSHLSHTASVWLCFTNFWVLFLIVGTFYSFFIWFSLVEVAYQSPKIIVGNKTENGICILNLIKHYYVQSTPQICFLPLHLQVLG